jgi:putative endonuclease
METFWVYILYSNKLDRYYVGSTDDLARRLSEHERGKTAYSHQGMPWTLMYEETFPSRIEAYRRELEIKGWKSRKRVELLVRTTKQDD